MDIELRNDRIPRNPFDRQFLDMIKEGTYEKIIRPSMMFSTVEHSELLD